MKTRLRSLAFRLVSLFVVLISTLLIGLAWITLSATDRHFAELDEGYLGDKAVLLKEIAAHSKNTTQLVDRVDQVLSSQAGLHIQLFERNDLIYQSSQGILPVVSIDGLRGIGQRSMEQFLGSGHDFRAMWLPLRLDHDAPESLIDAVLLLDTTHHDHYMSAFQLLIWIYVGAAIMIGGFLGWWATQMGLRPLRPIINQTRTISADHLDVRISAKDLPVELEPLAQTLNHMLERLEKDFKRLADFSTDLAHELRTPIGNMLVQAQVTLTKERGAAHYREALHSVVEELERLTQMVSDMLYLAKTENHLQLPNLETVDLFLQARELAEFHSLTAEDRQIKIEVVGRGSTLGDRSMLRRAISNLLANAIGHADASSVVCVEVEPGPRIVTLSVTNVGADIPKEVQARLFDRFFRGDAARQQPSSEGAGLGLAISQAVMKAHGGYIDVKSQFGKTKFTLVFDPPASAQ